MKAIKIGTKVEIYNDAVVTYDGLPAGAYVIRFGKMSGFYLDEYADIRINEEKIYGGYFKKVQKVLTAYAAFDRNLGVILSGQKGIGKSLFARMLSAEAIKNGLPVIVVDKYIPGIAAYIDAIDQRVLVLFDEFDKTFCDIRPSDGEPEPQATLLGLFDGISQGRKLFVITCNDIRKLNEHIVNRPGRFHYHFRFEHPSADEIRVYLNDKLKEGCDDAIEPIIEFSQKVDLNYDCLRAIAFEINSGESFRSAIKDLNIMNLAQESYKLTIYFKNGAPMSTESKQIDFFSNEAINVYFSEDHYNEILNITFWTKDSVYDMKDDCALIPAEKLRLSYDESYEEELVERLKELIPDHLSIRKIREKSLHYAI